MALLNLSVDGMLIPIFKGSLDEIDNYLKQMEKRKPYKGQDFSKVEVLTIPDASMSLQEIIDRFTRNEAVDVGFPVNFHESEDDLEKLRFLDPVEKREYIEKMKAVQDAYNVQEEKNRIALEEKTRKEFIAKVEKQERLKLQKAESGRKAK